MMIALRHSAIQFTFERRHNAFTVQALKEIEAHLKQSNEISYKTTNVISAYWFELEDEYLEENELPIQVDATFVTPEGRDVQGPVYVFFNFADGELTDQVELEIDELEPLK